MAIKLEADSTESRKEVELTEKQLTKETSVLKDRDRMLSAITESLLKFHRREQARLTTHAHDKDSTSQFLWKMAQLDAKTLAGLDLLHGNFEELLTRVDVSVYVTETLQRERHRSLALLGVEGDGVNGQTLDRAVERRLKDVPEGKPDDNQDDVIKELTSQVAALESSVAKQRAQVEGVRVNLEKANKTIAELRKLEKPAVGQVAAKPYHRAMWA